MLNLLRLREVADYSGSPELAPATPISGRDALQKYIDHTLPYLQESGGELLLLGNGGPFFIGPVDEQWDIVMLVKQALWKALWRFPRMQSIWPVWAIGRRQFWIRVCCPSWSAKI
ncbi:MAG: hypothetical protein R2911_19500 [Caldilineaceae bacterium]